MTRVLSAALLPPLVLGVVWFLPPAGTLVLAIVASVLAFVEYARIAATLGAVVPRARQMRLVMQAACHLFPGDAQRDAPALPAVQHLVNAVPPLPARREENRVEWVIGLFERLERNERMPARVPARVPRVVRS